MKRRLRDANTLDETRALQVIDIGGDHMVGFVRDADGVELVHVYQCEPIR